jgi:HSP20 family protein
MPKDKRSFFERLTGSISAYDVNQTDEEEDTEPEQYESEPEARNHKEDPRRARAIEVDEEEDDVEEEDDTESEGQLTVDVYQTANHIVIQTIVAGVRQEDLDVSITQDMITIKGRRERHREASHEDYYYQELYWGAFSRSLLLPQEVDAEEAEASLRNGLLTIRLPKLDKNRIQKLHIQND